MEEKKPNFLKRMIYGALIGMALIVPGFSGGTVAVIVGIYDQLINSISNLFKKFKESFLFLLPIVLGAIISILALVYPIKIGFRYIPLGMVCLFVGLMLGGCGPIVKKLKCGFTLFRIIPFAIAAFFAVGICFIPGLNILSSDIMHFLPLLFICVVGILAASGFIVPGISGSMIALIFGVYPLVVSSLSNFVSFNFTVSDMALFLSFLVGAVIGIFLISFIMKFMLRKYELGTYYAIAGFIFGSLFSIFYTQETLITDVMPIAVHIIIAIGLFIVGFSASLILSIKARKINKKE